MPCTMPQSLAHANYSSAVQCEFCTWQNSVGGQEPPKMYILCTSPGDGQTSCKVWLTCGDRRHHVGAVTKPVYS